MNRRNYFLCLVLTLIVFVRLQLRFQFEGLQLLLGFGLFVVVQLLWTQLRINDAGLTGNVFVLWLFSGTGAPGTGLMMLLSMVMKPTGYSNRRDVRRQKDRMNRYNKRY